MDHYGVDLLQLHVVVDNWCTYYCLNYYKNGDANGGVESDTYLHF